MPSKSEIVERLMKRHGRAYCDELGINIDRNTPSPLFCWLVASLLFSARIGAGQAVKAAQALFNAGWRTPQSMAAASWEERVHVLNRHGYARYDESTSRMLGETADILLDHYGGDLRKLRGEAGGDVGRLTQLLAEFKGIGKVGAGIFLREAQQVWDEYYPFADGRALKAAASLGLGKDAKTLAELVPERRFPKFLTALVRADLANEIGTIAKA